MATKDNAMVVLGHIYDLTIEQGKTATSEEKLSKESGLEISDINLALKYLDTRNLINATRVMSGKFIVIKLTDIGIQTVENKDEFKRNFGISVGIPGIISAHWGAEER